MNNAFKPLRISLTTLPLLEFADLDQALIVETDASSLAVGAVLA